MALTTFASTAAETVQRWATRVWIEMPRYITFGKFMKENAEEAIIEVKRDLEGNPGDKLTYSLLGKLNGAGVTGDDTLEGNEEELDYSSDSLTLDQRRNAVRLKGKLSEKRTAFDQQAGARTQLKTWLAETIDDNIFSNLDSAPTTVVFGSGTSLATLTAAGTITPPLIDRCVAKADKADPKIWPVRVEGDDYFVLLQHTDVWYDLRQNAVWQGYQQNGAQKPALDNPIFNGMAGIYNRTVIHTHEKVPVGTDAGAAGNVAYASNFFLGRQAGIFAWGAKPKAWTKEFDYGNSIGFAIGAIWAFKKAVFDANDHAMIALRVARTNN